MADKYVSPYDISVMYQDYYYLETRYHRSDIERLRQSAQTNKKIKTTYNLLNSTRNYMIQCEELRSALKALEQKHSLATRTYQVMERIADQRLEILRLDRIIYDNLAMPIMRATELDADLAILQIGNLNISKAENKAKAGVKRQDMPLPPVPVSKKKAKPRWTKPKEPMNIGQDYYRPPPDKWEMKVERQVRGETEQWAQDNTTKYSYGRDNASQPDKYNDLDRYQSNRRQGMRPPGSGQVRSGGYTPQGLVGPPTAPKPRKDKVHPHDGYPTSTMRNSKCMVQYPVISSSNQSTISNNCNMRLPEKQPESSKETGIPPLLPTLDPAAWKRNYEEMLREEKERDAIAVDTSHCIARAHIFAGFNITKGLVHGSNGNGFPQPPPY